MKEDKLICKYCGNLIKQRTHISQLYCDYECQTSMNKLVSKCVRQITNELIADKRDYIIDKAKEMACKKIEEMKENGDIKTK